MTRVGILVSLILFSISLFLAEGGSQSEAAASDWESYLGSLFPTCVLWVVIFCLVSAPDRTVSFFHFVILFECFGRNKMA